MIRQSRELQVVHPGRRVGLESSESARERDIATAFAEPSHKSGLETFRRARIERKKNCLEKMSMTFELTNNIIHLRIC